MESINPVISFRERERSRERDHSRSRKSRRHKSRSRDRHDDYYRERSRAREDRTGTETGIESVSRAMISSSLESGYSLFLLVLAYLLLIVIITQGYCLYRYIPHILCRPTTCSEFNLLESSEVNDR